MKFLIILIYPIFLLANNTVKIQENPLSLVESHIQNLYNKVAPAVVFITSRNSFGTGFFVSNSGYIITNSHVIEDKNDIIVVLYDGDKYKAKLVRIGKDNIDVALLKIYSKNKKFSYLKPENNDIRKIGTWVGTIGHGSGAIWSLNVGIISNIYNKESKKAIFQTQIPINPGSSGGPVFDKNGNILGIITAKLNNSSGINFAIDITKVMEALDINLAQKKVYYKFIIISKNKNLIFIDNKNIKINKHNKVVVKLKKGMHILKYISNGKLKKLKINIPKMKKIVID